jgi:hypothetical protein
MTIHEFEHKNITGNVLKICANKVEEAKVFIANHFDLNFFDWKYKGLISHDNVIVRPIYNKPYPYIIYKN